LGLRALALSRIPIEKRRRLVWCVVETWRAHVRTLSASNGERAGVRCRIFLRFLRSLAASVFACGGSPEGTPKRFRLPSFGWRFAAVITLICVIGSDPHFASLWTARAACGDVPSNTSTDTVRITTFSYDLDGRLAQVNSPEGCLNYEYSLATGRLTSTCTANSKYTYEYDSLGRPWKVNVLKRDNGSPFNHHAVDELLARCGVLPLNNPPHFPRYNGGMEKGIRDFKAALEKRLLPPSRVSPEFISAVELTAHELNHQSSRCLNGRTARFRF
jgi:YD repeat-containing protein